MKTHIEIYVFLLLLLSVLPVNASAACTGTDKACIMDEIESLAPSIDKQSWRDQTYRELAKAYTYEGMEDKAIALIDQIQTPDTKAMTIRGIGFAAADSAWEDEERYKTLFQTLAAKAEKIEHLPSQGIAWTYISMAQTFAHMDDDAYITAKSMDNSALRNKAFGENAEIQAERGEYNKAMTSIAAIDSLSFRNKAYGIIAKIFIKKDMLEEAYKTATQIDNPYNKAHIYQMILNHGNAEEDMTE